MSAGLGVLAEAGQTSLPLVVTWEVGDEVAAAAESDAALKEALGAAAQEQHDRDLVTRLQRAFQVSGLAEVAQLDRKAVLPPATHLGLTVHARYALDGTALEAGALRVRGLRIEWQAALRGAAAPKPGFTWETTTAPPDTLDPTEAKGVARPAAYAAELDAACADFAAKLGDALGLGSPPAAATTRTAALVSPYHR